MRQYEVGERVRAAACVDLGGAAGDRPRVGRAREPPDLPSSTTRRRGCRGFGAARGRTLIRECDAAALRCSCSTSRRACRRLAGRRSRRRAISSTWTCRRPMRPLPMFPLPMCPLPMCSCSLAAAGLEPGRSRLLVALLRAARRPATVPVVAVVVGRRVRRRPPRRDRGRGALPRRAGGARGARLALDAVLAPDALPPSRQQRRMARQRALAVLARIEARGAASDDNVRPRLVHLTRLEHKPLGAIRCPIRSPTRVPARRPSRPKQRGVVRVSSRPRVA